MPAIEDSGDDAIGLLLQDSAARLFAQHVGAATLREAEAGGFATALWRAVEEAGLPRALLPEAAGGAGAAAPVALRMLRVAAAHAAPLPLAETMLAACLITAAGLPAPDGPLSFACADVLRRDARGWRLHGVVPRVPWAGQARALALIAMVDGAAHLAMVAPPCWEATHGENLAREPRDDLRFDDHALPDAAVRPVAHDVDAVRAMAAAMRTQQIAGALTRVTAMTVRYAQERVQFGRPIGAFQAVQQNLAVLAGQSAAAAAAADLAAEAFAPLRILPIAAAKARAGEAAGIAAGIAHQMHGAIGFTYEHALHFLTRRLWAWRDEYGNEAHWNRRLGAHLLDAGADRLWTEITAA